MGALEKEKEMERQATLERFADLWDHPVDLSEYEEYERQMDEAVSVALKTGDPSRLNELGDPPGSVSFPDFSLLERLMVRILGDETEARESVDHEREHADQARQLGLECYPLLQVHVDSEGRLCFQQSNLIFLTTLILQRYKVL